VVQRCVHHVGVHGVGREVEAAGRRPLLQAPGKQHQCHLALGVGAVRAVAPPGGRRRGGEGGLSWLHAYRQRKGISVSIFKNHVKTQKTTKTLQKNNQNTKEPQTKNELKTPKTKVKPLKDSSVMGGA